MLTVWGWTDKMHVTGITKLFQVGGVAVMRTAQLSLDASPSHLLTTMACIWTRTTFCFAGGSPQVLCLAGVLLNDVNINICSI